MSQALWVDKYRPTHLDKLDFHKDQARLLKKLVESEDFPHLLMYGPPGAGKKTRIMCLLRELYGPGVERMRIEHHSFTTPSKKKLEVIGIASNFHVEINPSDVGIYDRVVIQEILKATAEAPSVNTNNPREFKVVVLSEVDHLTMDAQHALRRTMEKYTANCRIILCCDSISKVIPAIRSRCLGIRVQAPSKDDIIRVLQIICRGEGLNLPAELAKRVADRANGNLRRAILTLEACRVKEYPFNPNQAISDPDWEEYLRGTAALILKEQSPRNLLEIRNRLYELISHCIPPSKIFRVLVNELLNSIDGGLKASVIEHAAFYEYQMHLGSKAIFHIEAFVAKFMHLYLVFLEETMSDFL